MEKAVRIINGDPVANCCKGEAVSVVFRDPSWGMNGDASKHGGIDQPAEKWTRY